MKSNKYLKYIIGVVLILLLAGRLFLGIYQGREFGERYLFVKHRPAFKFNFYAPVGEADYNPSNLDQEQLYEETMYRDYVEGGGGYRRSIPIWY